MTHFTFPLYQKVAAKIWHSTIKIPELKTTIPAFESSFDLEEVTQRLFHMFKEHKGRILVVTGAGISTDSGIPDYRGEQGTYKRNPKFRPVLYQELASSHPYRQNYWSGSYLGWPKMSSSSPNNSHTVLASLMNLGYIQNIITQNVDSLHLKAGTPRDKLLELHGSLFVVECMECQAQTDRVHFQHRMHARNRAWNELLRQENQVLSDGHVNSKKSADDFDVPPCISCDSQKMKPKVVFFGETILPSVTEQAKAWVEQASAILVIGSSLATYSSYRLISLAHAQNKPIGILNLGPTRADSLMAWKGHVGCTPALTELAKTINKIH